MGRLNEHLYKKALSEWYRYGQNYNQVTASFFQRRLHINYEIAKRIADRISKEKEVNFLMKNSRKFLAQTKNENVLIFIIGLILLYLASVGSVTFGILGLGGFLGVISGATGFFWVKTNKREKRPLSWVYILLIGNVALFILGMFMILMANPAQY